MPIEVDYQQKSKNIKEIYTFDPEYPKERHLAYRIDTKKEVVEFFPKENFDFKKITLEGFKYLPEIMNEKGYFRAGLDYYLDKKLKQNNVKSFIISKHKNNKINRSGKNYKLTVNYDIFNKFRKDVNVLKSEGKAERSQFIDDFFAQHFPKKYQSTGMSAGRRAKKIINNLDDSIIGNLSANDVNKLISFVESILKSKYKSIDHKHKLFGGTKIKVDHIAVSEVLGEFDDLLIKNPHETKWGEFLKKNLYLLDSKYVSIIPELNVVLSTQRKVDFGLVDSQGFLDIFEIKKPNTKLLATKPDRGNFFWSTDSVKAITQAEKYLYNAESKKHILAGDIKRENDISVNVIKPRAFLVMGMSTQLNTDKKIEDFRVLRRSLKNVEIILYDELFDRFKNQQNKIYIE